MQSSGSQFDALLFDMDGTLIDSMPLHHRAWARWFAAQELPFDEDGFFAASAGRTNQEILAEMFPHAKAAEVEAMAFAKESLYRDEAARHLAEIPGALALLKRLRQAGKKVAICTAAPPENIAVAMAKFGLNQWVDTVACPADGLRGKPHPDIFEAAAQRLGVPASRCLVFEDAPLGLEAAHRAGMRAVALTTSLPASDFDGFPNRIASVKDFTELDPALLFS